MIYLFIALAAVLLLAALLMLITICCLYSAVKSDKGEDDYCFE